MPNDLSPNGLRRSGSGAPKARQLATRVRELFERTWVPALLLAVFVCLSTVILLSWTDIGIAKPTGDEPYYLTLARAVAHGQLGDVRAAYADEFAARQLWDGWPAAGTPVGANAHLVEGPGGWYSLHGLGLPTVLALPTLIGGVGAARAVMIAFGLLFVALAWWISGQFCSSKSARAAAVAAAAVSAPFLTAVTQVYPDLPAGVVFVLGVCGLLGRPGAKRWLPFLAAAILPWLQIKFGVLAATLICAGLVRVWLDGGRFKRLSLLLAVPIASGCAIALYNLSLAHSINPYPETVQRLDASAVMRTFGLVFDQNQGLLFANPWLVLGAVGLIPLWRRDRIVALTVGFGAASILGMNAMHSNPYGGYSLSGRFGWTTAAILVVPTIACLLSFAHRAPRVFYAAVALGIALQAIWIKLVLQPYFPLALYNRTDYEYFLSGNQLLQPAYGGLTPSLSNRLPAWYQPEWAFASTRNWSWVALVLLAMLVVGAVLLSRKRRVVLIACGSAAFALAIVGCYAAPVPAESQDGRFALASLPATTGRIVKDQRVVVEGVDKPGLLAGGPNAVFGLGGLNLVPGNYTATFAGKAAAGKSTVLGSVRVLGDDSGSPVDKSVDVQPDRSLPSISFTIRKSQVVQFQLLWNGAGAASVEGLRIVRNSTQ